MLKKLNRLTKNKEFDNVFKGGRSSYAKVLGVKTARNDAGIIRVGILVSNKVSKKATDRNKIKRRVRESFRSVMEKLAGADYVVVVLPPALGASFAEIDQALNRCLKAVGAFKNHA